MRPSFALRCRAEKILIYAKLLSNGSVQKTPRSCGDTSITGKIFNFCKNQLIEDRNFSSSLNQILNGRWKAKLRIKFLANFAKLGNLDCVFGLLVLVVLDRNCQLIESVFKSKHKERTRLLLVTIVLPNHVNDQTHIILFVHIISGHRGDSGSERSSCYLIE